MYSRYPARSRFSRASSSVMRRASTARPAMTISRPQYEPRASGMPTIRIDVAEVHRVPDESVPARRRQLLAGLDGDIGCGITVLDRHQHRDGEADADEDEPDNRNGCGHRRPAEAEVQRTDHDHGDHGYERHGDDDLLQAAGSPRQGPLACVGAGRPDSFTARYTLGMRVAVANTAMNAHPRQ